MMKDVVAGDDATGSCCTTKPFVDVLNEDNRKSQNLISMEDRDIIVPSKGIHVVSVYKLKNINGGNPMYTIPTVTYRCSMINKSQHV